MNDVPRPRRTPSVDSTGVGDPVHRRRQLIARWTTVANRVGYTLYAAAIVLFVAGLATGWSQGFTVAITGCLVLGSLLLAPAIVLGYAIKAAEREDAEIERRRRGTDSR